MQRPKVDENFFSKWSPDMAYILGFIYADGCLVEHKNGYHGLDITSKDVSHLETIKQLLKSEHKISKKERGFRIQIRNKQIYNDLIGLGLVPRKSKRVNFPKIPDRHFPHFIRGLFDGDGSVYTWNESRWKHSRQMRTTFSSGSVKFIEALRNELFKRAGLSNGYLRAGCRAMELAYAINDSLVLYRFMYRGDSSVYLNRKKQRFDLFFSSRN